MAKPIVKAVVAMASNRVIGKDGDLPWRLPEDLKWFKKLTLGQPIVMGRKTMESIGRPLPKRRNIVLSRSLTEVPEGFELLDSPDAIWEHLADEEAICIIGGAEIYRLLLPACNELYLSYVYHPYDGDTELPLFEEQFELAETLYQDDDFELRRYIKKEEAR